MEAPGSILITDQRMITRIAKVAEKRAHATVTYTARELINERLSRILQDEEGGDDS